MNNNIEIFYREILALAGLTVDETGIIHRIDKELGPFTISGKQAALATPDNLKRMDLHVFHPLNENWMDGRGETFTAYAEQLMFTTNKRLLALAANILEISLSVDIQKRLNSSALNIISTLGQVDAKFYDTFFKIAGKAVKTFKNGYLVNYNVKKNAQGPDKVKHAAVGVLVFPLYDEFKKEPERVLGVNLRQKDIEPLDALFKLINPNVDEPEHYTSYNNNKIFRYLEALLTVSYKLYDEYNKTYQTLKDVLDDQVEYVSLGWYDRIKDLENDVNDIRYIPNQDKPGAAEKRIAKIEEQHKEETRHNAHDMVNQVMHNVPVPASQTTARQQSVAQPSYQHPQQVQQPSYQPPTSEQILQARMNGQDISAMQRPVMQPMYQQPVTANIPPWAEQPVQQMHPGITPEQIIQAQSGGPMMSGYGSPSMPAWVSEPQMDPRDQYQLGHMAQQPMYQQPGYPQPMMQQPMYQQPGYPQPMMQQPMYPQQNYGYTR